MYQLAADHDGMVHRTYRLFDGALDADIASKDRKPQGAQVIGVAHTRVGDQRGDALGFARVGEHVAEGARLGELAG